MIEDDDDRLIFFSDFAEEVPIHVVPTVGAPFDVVGTFETKPVDTRSFQNRLPDHGGAQPSGSSPKFRCRSSDMPKSLIGQAVVTIRTLNYSIFDIDHDGTGMAHVTVKRT